MGIVVAIVVVAGAVMILLIDRRARIASLWGAAIGPAFGVWCVAPRLLDSHHLRPESPTQWLVVSAFVVIVFVAIGLVLSASTGWMIGLVRLVRRRNVNYDVGAAAAWIALVIPVAYFFLGLLIEYSFSGRMPARAAIVPSIWPLMSWFVIVGVAATVLWRLRWISARAIAGCACMLVLIGVGLWPFGLAGRSISSDDNTPLQRAGKPQAPLLVIGLDGGNWRTLRPMIDRHRAPTFAALEAEGIRGEVTAQWPPFWSAPAWGAILTGHDKELVGVNEDLTAVAPGLPMFELPLTLDPLLNPVFLVEYILVTENVIEPAPTPRTKLQRAPVWERLSAAGDRTAVIGFPFTYPAHGQAEYVVSDRVGIDLWDMMSVEVGIRSELVSPAARSEQLLGWFQPDRAVDPQLFERLFPDREWPKPADAAVDPIEVLKRVLRDNESMFDLTEELLRSDPDLDVVMLYVGSFDNICHAFWQYRFPEDFPDRPPAPADVAALGPVLDRYLEYLDGRLAHLLAAFQTRPDVLIVSDHGQQRTDDLHLWKGGHGPGGVFMAAGPHVPRRTTPVVASYFDIVPTVLAIRQFQHSPELTGRSLLRAD